MPCRGVRVLAEKLAILRGGRFLEPIDDVGHLQGIGAEVQFRHPYEADLETRLADGQQILAEFHDEAIIFACSFATTAPNPHVCIGCPGTALLVLSEADREPYEKLVRSFSRAINSSYIVCVDDAPDDFEERFIDIDGRRFLDNETRHCYGNGVVSVLVDKTKALPLPEGIEATSCSETPDGFRVFHCI